MVTVDWLGMFAGIMTLAFAVFSFLAGGFTAYFGTGRSRSIGGGLVLLGVITLVIFLWFTGILPGLAIPWYWDPTLMGLGVVAVLGTVAGAVIALLIFLGAIMKT